MSWCSTASLGYRSLTCFLGWSDLPLELRSTRQRSTRLSGFFSSGLTSPEFFNQIDALLFWTKSGIPSTLLVMMSYMYRVLSMQIAFDLFVRQGGSMGFAAMQLCEWKCFINQHAAIALAYQMMWQNKFFVADTVVHPEH